jgi:hypothetical protein
VIGWPLLQATDLRGDDFLVFGLLLYFATLIPGHSPFAICPRRPIANPGLISAST